MMTLMRKVLSILTCTLLCTYVEVRAATYYASPGGSGSTCTSAAAPCSLNTALSKPAANAGDTVQLRGGTYSGINSNTVTINGGSSWSNPTTIMSYPGETATLTRIGNEVVNIPNTTDKYTVYDGLVIDGAGSAGSVGFSIGGVAHHIRIQNCEIKNNGAQGIYTGDGMVGVEVLNNDIHHNGNHVQNDHGIYHEGSDGKIIGNHFHHNSAYGIQLYNGYQDVVDRNIISGNMIDNNGAAGSAGGVTLGRGNDNQFFNNVVHSNGLMGMQVSSGTPNNTQIYNNTFYNNATIGIRVASGASNTRIRGNIINTHSSSAVNDEGSSALQCTDNLGTSSFCSNNSSGSPNFAGAPTNLHITTGSAAIGIAPNFTGLYSTDFDGNGRAPTGNWDAGAYTYVSASVTYHLEVTVQPSHWYINQVLPDWTVVVKDDTNTIVTSYNGPASISLGSNPGSATLSGTVSGAFSAGVATWCCDLQLNQNGVGYTFVHTASGLGQSITTSGFNITTPSAPSGQPPLVMRFVPR